MIVAQKQTVGLNNGTASGGVTEASCGTYVEPRDTRPKLRDAGTSRKLSAKARKIAAAAKARYSLAVGEGATRSDPGSRPRKRKIGNMVEGDACVHDPAPQVLESFEIPCPLLHELAPARIQLSSAHFPRRRRETPSAVDHVMSITMGGDDHRLMLQRQVVRALLALQQQLARQTLRAVFKLPLEFRPGRKQAALGPRQLVFDRRISENDLPDTGHQLFDLLREQQERQVRRLAAIG